MPTTMPVDRTNSVRDNVKLPEKTCNDESIVQMKHKRSIDWQEIRLGGEDDVSHTFTMWQRKCSQIYFPQGSIPI